MIRPVKVQDADAITAIYNHYVTETTVSFETKPLTVSEMAARIEDIASQYPYCVYEEDGRVLGYCYAHRWKERAAYGCTAETTVYLAPEAIGRGIGRALMTEIIDWCRSLLFKSLIACITAENTASIDFHRSLGFTQVSDFKEVGYKFGRYLDVVDLQLTLE